ncbi:MAG: hypothetical protein ACI4JW_00810 [Oscillospiraceae bacterium]
MNRYFNIKLADVVIRIEHIHDYIQEYCQGYLTDEKADFCAAVSPSDIEYERERSAAEDKKEGIPVRSFSEGYLETLAVYRKIADKMPEYDTVLFHGSVVAVDGIGYMFTAKSGTGKSTHTRLWRELFGERAVMINDDKPLIKVTKSGITAYGTPWNGKHRLGTNMGAPLKAVCVLERSEENRIEKVTAGSVYNMLIQQVYRPHEPQALVKTLQLIDILSGNTELYKLGCNMDISAAEIAYNAMKGNNTTDVQGKFRN